MRRGLRGMAWLLPLLVLAHNVGCGIDNCRNLPVVEFQSGTYESHGGGGVGIIAHHNGAAKVLDLDLATSTAVFTYLNSDGRQIVEVWDLSEVTVW